MAHYYTRDGKPHFYLTGKNGKLRDTTIKDARELDLIPSVTEILKLLDKPAITKWKLDCADKGIDWKQESRKALGKGEEIHSYIQRFIEDGDIVVSSEDNTAEIMGALYPTLKGFEGECEKVVVGDNYAGTVDFIGKTPFYFFGDVIVDFKTQKTQRDKAPVFYDHWVYQLAAYKQAVGGDYSLLSIIISSTEIDKISFKIWTEEEEKRSLVIFNLLLKLFYEIKRL